MSPLSYGTEPFGGPLHALDISRAWSTFTPTNMAQDVIAELLFVDQSTISRAISDLEGIIAEALDEFVPELPDEIEAPAMFLGQHQQIHGSFSHALQPALVGHDLLDLLRGENAPEARHPARADALEAVLLLEVGPGGHELGVLLQPVSRLRELA